ncbi:gibberellin-regulated protein 2-like [Nymphaea colorata]|nr:gibberellin-regulated protein 2-like [Nymphaea colorata]
MAKYSGLAFLLLLVLTMIIQCQATCSDQEKSEMMNAEHHEGSRLLGGKIDCGAACSYRCSKASRQKICLRACGTCCARCNCVPPGTSGNTHVCPCYATMTTHGGRLKCP